MANSATKTIFLEMLSDEQLGIFYAHEGQPTCDDAMANMLTYRQYKVYKAVQEELQTEKYPDFLDEMSLTDSQRISFRELIDDRKFGILDTVMDVYPKYLEPYNEWKNELLSSTGGSISKKTLHREPSYSGSLSSMKVDHSRRATRSSYLTDVPDNEVFSIVQGFKPPSYDLSPSEADDTRSECSDVTEVAENDGPEMPKPAIRSLRATNTLHAEPGPATTEDPLFVDPNVFMAVNSAREQLNVLANQARRMLRFLENTQELAKMNGADIDITRITTVFPNDYQDSEFSLEDDECGFCKGDHQSNYCKKYPTLDGRLDTLSQIGCMRCLREHQDVCDTTFCDYCQSTEHHESLCPCYEHRQFLKALQADAEGGLGSSSSSESISISRF